MQPLFRFTIVLAALGLSAACAAAGPFSDLFVFGDSLSDVGNVSQATQGLVPGPFYDEGRFSNGPVYVEALAEGLGLGPPIHSRAGGNNFAHGGAQTSGTGGLNGFFIDDVDEQVDDFLGTRTVDPSALYVIFAGSNDLLGGQGDVSIPVNRLANEMGRLVGAGAQQFLVPNLPLLGFTPRFNGSPATVEQYNSLSIEFNAALDTALDILQTSEPEATFFRLDVADLLSQAVADPESFGLSNVTDAAAPGLEPGDNSYDTSQIADQPNEYLYWDDLHPTAAVHAILAQQALALLLSLPGDYNANGIVDAADYTLWRDGLGTTYTQDDYDVWKANFGETALGSGSGSLGATGSASALANVPEPASCALCLLAVLVAMAVGRRR